MVGSGVLACETDLVATRGGLEFRLERAGQLAPKAFEGIPCRV